MISQKFADIVLSDEDWAEINARVEARGEMPAHNKGVLRQMLAREMKEGIWSNRDYVYGQDEGEPPKGASW